MARLTTGGVVVSKTSLAPARKVVRVCILPGYTPAAVHDSRHPEDHDVLAKQLKDIEIIDQVSFSTFSHGGELGIFGLNHDRQIVKADAVVGFGSFPSVFLGQAIPFALTHAVIPALVLFRSFRESCVSRDFAHVKRMLPRLLTLYPYDDPDQLLGIVVPFVREVAGSSMVCG